MSIAFQSDDEEESIKGCRDIQENRDHKRKTEKIRGRQSEREREGDSAAYVISSKGGSSRDSSFGQMMMPNNSTMSSNSCGNVRKHAYMIIFKFV